MRKAQLDGLRHQCLRAPDQALARGEQWLTGSVGPSVVLAEIEARRLGTPRGLWRLELPPVGALQREHGRNSVLLNVRRRLVGNESVESAAHEAKQEPRRSERQSQMTLATDLERLLGIEVLDKLPCPTIAGFSSVLLQLRSGHLDEYPLQRLERRRTLDRGTGRFVRGSAARIGRIRRRRLQQIRQSNRGRKNMVTDCAGAAAAARVRRTARIEGDPMLADFDRDDRGRILEELYRGLLEVLASTAQQPTVAECRERLVVIAAELRSEFFAERAHEMTSTSHCASRCGVSAAISMPLSASCSAMCRS